jgi:uncharacterized delta-60 repeat protein
LALFAALHAPTLAQATKPGHLDRSFGHNGKVKTGFECRCSAHSVAIDRRGRIVAVGGAPGANGDFAIARYRPSGKLDPSFSDDGQATTDFFGGGEAALSAAIDSHRRIVAAGYACQPPTTRCPFSYGDVSLARYEPDGTLDGTFGRKGRVWDGFPSGFQARAVAIDSRDRIVVVGSSADFFALARFRPSGSLDRSFGSDGRVITEMGPRNRTDFANSVAIDSRGRIVAAGYTHRRDATRVLAVARYKPDGSLDRSFSGNGMTRTAFNGLAYANSVAIDSENRIIAGGVGKRSKNYVFALARYKPDGRLDRAFSRDGTVMTAFHSPSIRRGAGAAANAVVVDSRDRVVAAGVAGDVDYQTKDNQLALARYRPNGRLDRSFSDDGKVSRVRSNHGARGAATDSRDRIVVADGVSKFVLYRYIG